MATLSLYSRALSDSDDRRPFLSDIGTVGAIPSICTVCVRSYVSAFPLPDSILSCSARLFLCSLTSEDNGR